MKEKMGQVQISVIVPVYNTEKYVEACINSLLTQTYKNLEIIAIDDGSTDQSGSILDRLNKMDERLMVIHQENGGVSRARNLGIEKAHGKYVAFVDADDWANKMLFEQLMQRMELYQADMVISQIIETVSRDTDEIRDDQSDVVLSQSEAVKQLIEDTKIRSFFQGKLFKKELFKNSSFPLDMRYEDLALFQDLVLQCQTVVYTDNAYFYYYQHEESKLHSRDLQLNLDQIKAYQMQTNSICKVYPEYQIQLDYRNFAFELSTCCYYLKEFKGESKYLESMRELYQNTKHHYTKLKKENMLTGRDRLCYLKCMIMGGLNHV